MKFLFVANKETTRNHFLKPGFSASFKVSSSIRVGVECSSRKILSVPIKTDMILHMIIQLMLHELCLSFTWGRDFSIEIKQRWLLNTLVCLIKLQSYGQAQGSNQLLHRKLSGELVMDREAWRAAIHGFAKRWIRLSDWIEAWAARSGLDKKDSNWSLDPTTDMPQ